jgi:hypothetical protein
MKKQTEFADYFYDDLHNFQIYIQKLNDSRK